MNGPRHIRDVLQGVPELRRYIERKDALDFPTPEELAAAEHELARERSARQSELPLAGHELPTKGAA
jgi:hypothetical protein